MTCSFVGHREVERKGSLSSRIRSEIETLILAGTNIFLCGGMGDFDGICAYETAKLKEVYPHIRSILVIPYLSFKSDRFHLFDEVLYPDLEKYSYKNAIIYRNRYMVEKSEYVLSYVCHSFGGAYRTLQYAERRHCHIINIADLIETKQ